MAPQELENSASKHAAQAIKFDSQGARGMAISEYQRAIDDLVKLMQLYPSSKLNPVYKQRATSYQDRIKALQETHGVEPAVDPDASPEEQKKSLATQQDKNDFDDMIMKEKPGISWDDVVGIEEAKKALESSIVFPAKRPDLFPIGWAHGILLYGPPGCGKTILAAATAADIDGYFINVDAASLMSKWLGEAEKNISKLFKLARGYAEKEGKPVILFIDEIDSLLGERGNEIGGEVRSRNELLKSMDGIKDKGKNIKLYVIGATNKPWSIDEPFLRRFQSRVYVPLPTVEARKKLFEMYLGKLKTDQRVRSQTLSNMFDGYSASDIKDVCQAAQIKVVQEMFESPDYREPVEGEEPPQPRLIASSDFKEILERRKPSVSQEMIQAYYKWSEEHKALS